MNNIKFNDVELSVIEDVIRSRINDIKNNNWLYIYYEQNEKLEKILKKIEESRF